MQLGGVCRSLSPSISKQQSRLGDAVGESRPEVIRSATHPCKALRPAILEGTSKLHQGCVCVVGQSAPLEGVPNRNSLHYAFSAVHLSLGSHAREDPADEIPARDIMPATVYNPREPAMMD